MAIPITHHPPDDTVLRYANGTLPEAPAVVVATHLSFCPACRRRMETYEALGGSMLESVPPAELSRDALSATLARLDALTGTSANHTVEQVPDRPALPLGLEWPGPLRPYALSRWRSVGAGVNLASVSFANPGSGKLLVVHGMPGAKLPAHGHDGTEYTCVLTGSYSDASGIFSAGDLVEADEDDDHQPIVGSDAECVCVIAIDGHLRLHGIARIVRPLLGL